MVEEIIGEAQALIMEGAPDKALQLLMSSGDEGMANPIIRNKIGVCYISLGRTQEAETEFRAAITLDCECSPAYTNLGNIFKERGDVEKAIEYYEKAIKADPTYPNAYHNLGVLYNGLRRYDKGIPLIKTGKQLELGKGDIKRGKRKQTAWRYSWVAVAFVIGAVAMLLSRLK